MPRRLDSAEHDVVFSCWVDVPAADGGDLRCDFTFPDGRPMVTVARRGPGPLSKREHDHARAVALDTFAEHFHAAGGDGFSISRAMGADPSAPVRHRPTTWTPWHGHVAIRCEHHCDRGGAYARRLADELHPPSASQQQRAAIRQLVKRMRDRGLLNAVTDDDGRVLQLLPTAEARALAAEYESAALPKPS